MLKPIAAETRTASEPGGSSGAPTTRLCSSLASVTDRTTLHQGTSPGWMTWRSARCSAHPPPSAPTAPAADTRDASCGLQRSSRIASPRFPPDRARSTRGDPPEQSGGDGDVSEKAGGIQTRAQVDSLRSGPHGLVRPAVPTVERRLSASQEVYSCSAQRAKCSIRSHGGPRIDQNTKERHPVQPSHRVPHPWGDACRPNGRPGTQLPQRSFTPGGEP